MRKIHLWVIVELLGSTIRECAGPYFSREDARAVKKKLEKERDNEELRDEYTGHEKFYVHQLYRLFTPKEFQELMKNA